MYICECLYSNVSLVNHEVLNDITNTSILAHMYMYILHLQGFPNYVVGVHTLCRYMYSTGHVELIRE